MSNPPNKNQLYPLIEQGVELLRKLDVMLESERQALTKRDLDSIQQSTEEKSALLLEIQTNFNARHELLTSLGVELSGDGWARYLSTLATEDSTLLEKEWRTLSQILEKTQKASLINQQLVTRGQENTTRLLNLLQGKNKASQLYGSSGQSNNFSTQSRLGKA